MGFVKQTSSGKWQGCYYDKTKPRRANGKLATTIGPSFDHREDAAAWAQTHDPQAVAREEGVARPYTPTAGRVRFDALLRTMADEPVTDTLTLAEFSIKWLGAQHGIATATLRSYRTAVDLGIIRDPELRSIPMADLQRSDVDAWMARQEHAGVGPRARAYRLGRLRAICQAAMRDRRMTGLLADPTAGIRRPKGLIRERTFLSDTEVSDLLAAVDTDQDMTLAVLLAVDAGLRWSEITGLGIGSVVTRGNSMTLRIWQSYDRETGEVKNTTKNGAERSVPVRSARLRAALSLAVKKARLRDGIDARVLAPRSYDRWHKMGLKIAFRRAAIYPEPRGWHDLRHTFGSRLAEAGVPTKMISTLMGHSDSRVTEIYMHASTLATMEAALDQALSS